MRGSHFRLPLLSLRFVHVWRRNFLVWRKLAIPSMLGNLADPMFYLLALGYGLGRLVPEVQGMPYISFLAGGIICSSTMNTATFEALWSAFSRMHNQRTWESIMNAPIALDDIVLAEAVWAASKSVLSGSAILLVSWLLGLWHSPLTLWVLPVTFLIGITFGAMGLIVTAVAPSYDFFMYYFTLVITPMLLASGVFFPLDQLPLALQWIASALPLTHAIALVRPLVHGEVPVNALGHAAVMFAVTALCYYVALVLTRRRLLT
jgi:lipooligosaccharide transport system permease protein